MQGHNGQLKAFIERVERLNEEEAAIKADKRDVFAEAKSNGFDPKVLRRVIQIRAGDAAAHEEFETLVDTYLAALGQGNAYARDTREADPVYVPTPVPAAASIDLTIPAHLDRRVTPVGPISGEPLT